MIDVSNIETILARIKPPGERSPEDTAYLRALAASDAWYHVLELGDGIVTNGAFDVAATLEEYRLDATYEGRRILDVGSSNGFYSIEFARRGASEVVALDLHSWEEHDWSPRKKAELMRRPATERQTTDSITLAGAMRIAVKATGAPNIAFVESRIYDISPDTLGQFDVVFCGAMLMHVRDPLLGLQAMRSVLLPGGELILSVSTTAAIEDSELPLAAFIGEWDQSNFWQLSPRCLVTMLEAADFEVSREPTCFNQPAERGGFVDRLCVVAARPRQRR